MSKTQVNEIVTELKYQNALNRLELFQWFSVGLAVFDSFWWFSLTALGVVLQLSLKRDRL